MSAADKYHAHLDVCHQCQHYPFEQCPTGAALLVEVAREFAKDPKIRGLAKGLGVVIRDGRGRPRA